MENEEFTGYQAGQNGTPPHYILKEQRLLLGMTQQGVAAAAGISVQQYQKFESGVRNIKTASFQVACSVIEALQMDIKDFFHCDYHLGPQGLQGPQGQENQQCENQSQDLQAAAVAPEMASEQGAEAQSDSSEAPSNLTVIPAKTKNNPMPIQLYCELLFFIPDGKVTTEEAIFAFVNKATGMNFNGFSDSSMPFLLRNLSVDYEITAPGSEPLSQKIADCKVNKEAGMEQIPYWKVVSKRGHLSNYGNHHSVDTQERLLNETFVETEEVQVGTATGIRVKNLEEYLFDWNGVSFNKEKLNDRSGYRYSWSTFNFSEAMSSFEALLGELI